MHKLKCVAVSTLAVLTVSGCSALSVGSDKFSCPGMPNGVVCKSTSEVYALTNGNIRGEPVPVTGLSSDGTGSFSDKRGGADGYDAYGRPYVLNVNTLPTRPMQAPATGVQPVLEPAKVVRIWVGPWRDSQNNLVFPTYLYAQASDRQWSVRGADFEKRGGVFTPVQVRSYESSSAEDPAEENKKP